MLDRLADDAEDRGAHIDSWRCPCECCDDGAAPVIAAPHDLIDDAHQQPGAQPERRAGGSTERRSAGIESTVHSAAYWPARAVIVS